jgi:hypothetical protein
MKTLQSSNIVQQLDNSAIKRAMTLNSAEEITSYVTNLIATKPPDACCRLSQLRGHTLPEIYNAFCLIIATQRQIGSYDPSSRAVSREYADRADMLFGALSFAVLCDADMDRLAEMQKDSPEFTRAFLDAIYRRREQSEAELKADREAFVTFHDYCWSIESADPLYWQRIYTRLDLPYGETCPTGEPDITINNRGDLAWQAQSVKERAQMPFYRVFLWTIGILILLWLFAKFAD